MVPEMLCQAQLMAQGNTARGWAAKKLPASTMFAVPTFAADYSGEDPQLEKNIKILTIWAEDNDNGMLLNKICEDYQKNVNPNYVAL